MSAGIKPYDLIIASGDCLSFSVKKISKPIALGLAALILSRIFAKTETLGQTSFRIY